MSKRPDVARVCCVGVLPGLATREQSDEAVVVAQRGRADLQDCFGTRWVVPMWIWCGYAMWIWCEYGVRS